MVLRNSLTKMYWCVYLGKERSYQGVPQGTVLGPTLSSTYINDVVDNIQYSKIRLFTDDIILY